MCRFPNSIVTQNPAKYDNTITQMQLWHSALLPRPVENESLWQDCKVYVHITKMTNKWGNLSSVQRWWHHKDFIEDSQSNVRLSVVMWQIKDITFWSTLRLRYMWCAIMRTFVTSHLLAALFEKINILPEMESIKWIPFYICFMLRIFPNKILSL